MEYDYEDLTYIYKDWTNGTPGAEIQKFNINILQAQIGRHVAIYGLQVLFNSKGLCY